MNYAIYNPDGKCTARLLYVEDAAMLVAMLGEGYTIRVGRTIVWHEGHEEFSAAESYGQAVGMLLHRRAGRCAT